MVPGTYVLELDSIKDHDDELLSGPTWTRLHTRETQFEYDAFGSPTKITVTQPNSRRVDVVGYENDTAAWLIGKPSSRETTSCTRPENVCQTRESTFHYDDDGDLDEAVVEPNSPDDRLRTTLGRDLTGNITSVTLSNAAGETRATTIRYDPVSLYPVSVTNGLGQVSRMSVHSGLGVTLSRTDPNGVCSTMSHDGFGRLRETRYADGYFERVANFGPLAYFVSIPDAAGGSVVAESIFLDKLGREREHSTIAFNDEMSTTRTRYDRRGRVISRSRPYFAGDSIYQTTYTYDTRDRLTKITEPDAVTTRHEYIGLETHTYDGKGIHSFVVENADGQLESRYEDEPGSPLWIVTQFGYGPFGLLASTRAVADGTIQSMAYDRRGRRIEHIDPSTGTTTFDYNAFGDLVTEVNGAGEVTELEHDVLGRTRIISSPDGQTTLFWDTAVNGIGKLARSVSGDGVIHALRL